MAFSKSTLKDLDNRKYKAIVYLKLPELYRFNIIIFEK